MSDRSRHGAEVVIVGAGPAGMSAAVALAEQGIPSLVLDETPAPGGAIFRPPRLYKRRTIAAGAGLEDKLKNWLLEQFHRFVEDGVIALLLGTEVLGASRDAESEDFSIWIGGDSVKVIQARRLIICAGCYERSQPFPGWTLPGVMGVGGAQLQVKAGLVRPAERMVIVGTGPLLLVAAKQLHDAGIQVAGVFEAGRYWHMWRAARDLLAGNRLLLEGMKLLWDLRQRGIEVRDGMGIVAARGAESVEEVEIAPYTNEWRPVPGKSRTIQADGLAVGYGFVSRVQLLQLLGCTLEYDAFLGGGIPVRDDSMQTSQPGLYAAGDGAGVYGAIVAASEGRIAADGCIQSLRPNGASLSGLVQRDLPMSIGRPSQTSRRFRAFRRAFRRLSTIGAGMQDLVTENVLVCKCERVTRKQVDDAIMRGARSMTDVKIQTRVGMGDCQGKICSSFCAEYLANKISQPLENVELLRPRFPLAPVSFSMLMGDPA